MQQCNALGHMYASYNSIISICILILIVISMYVRLWFYNSHHLYMHTDTHTYHMDGWIDVRVGSSNLVPCDFQLCFFCSATPPATPVKGQYTDNSSLLSLSLCVDLFFLLLFRARAHEIASTNVCIPVSLCSLVLRFMFISISLYQSVSLAVHPPSISVCSLTSTFFDPVSFEALNFMEPL